MNDWSWRWLTWLMREQNPGHNWPFWHLPFFSQSIGLLSLCWVLPGAVLQKSIKFWISLVRNARKLPFESPIGVLSLKLWGQRICEVRGYVRPEGMWGHVSQAAGQWQHSLNLLKHTFPHWASSKLLLQCTRIFYFRTTDQLPNQDTELLLLVLNIHPSLGSFPPSSFNLNCFFCLCFTPVLFTFFFPSLCLSDWQQPGTGPGHVPNFLLSSPSQG